MNNKYRFGGLFAAALVVLILAVAVPMVAQGDRSYPLWVNVPGVTLQMTTYSGIPAPAFSPPSGPNSGKYYLTAQLAKNTSLQPPFVMETVPIQSVTITPAPAPPGAVVPSFATPICTISPDALWLTCQFGPSSTQWDAAGNAVFRMKVTSTTGYGTMSLITFRVN